MNAARSDNTAEVFRFRTGLLLGVMILWAAAAAACLVYYTAIKKNDLMAESSHLAWRSGVLPAPRGRILDADGVALAWTEMYHDLDWEVMPERPGRWENLRGVLKSEFGFDAPENPKLPLRVLANVQPDPQTLERLCRIADAWPELRLTPRLERRRVDYPELAAFLGVCETDADGVPAGRSGCEERFNRILAGVPGKITVMLDRSGRWIRATQKLDVTPKPGADIRLELTLKELLKMKAEESAAVPGEGGL